MEVLCVRRRKGEAARCLRLAGMWMRGVIVEGRKSTFGRSKWAPSLELMNANESADFAVIMDVILMIHQRVV